MACPGSHPGQSALGGTQTCGMGEWGACMSLHVTIDTIEDPHDALHIRVDSIPRERFGPRPCILCFYVFVRVCVCLYVFLADTPCPYAPFCEFDTYIELATAR